MNVVHSIKWGEPSKVEDTLSNSECFVAVVPGDKHPELIHIEFHGTLANIPMLKNRKIPGKNFINPDVGNKLKAMDALFKREAAQYSELSFADTPVHVLLICGERGRNFDPINCLETVQDWLEPATKPVGRKKNPRGWGVGLVNDDKQITSYALHSRITEVRRTYSTIILRPLAMVQKEVSQFVNSLFLNGVHSTQEVAV